MGKYKSRGEWIGVNRDMVGRVVVVRRSLFLLIEVFRNEILAACQTASLVKNP